MSRANILNTRDRAKTPQDVFALLDALEGRAELFATLSDPNHGFYADDGKFRNDFPLLSVDHRRAAQEVGQVHLRSALGRCIRSVLRPRHGFGHY
ncbi:MAG: hypothetical protein M3461_14095 [Pseudomonadota bacterium]|nr:hypothetical protein [Pseudomonadota bacterium]